MSVVIRHPAMTLGASSAERLTRVKERLATEHLQDVLDDDCKAWYIHRMATALAPHLLEFYQAHLMERVTTQGIDVIPPAARALLQVLPATTETTVQCTWSPAAVSAVSAALAQELAASDAASGWDTLARRVAIDLTASALDTLHQTHSADAVHAMTDPVFETAILCTVVALDPTAFRTRVRQCLDRLAQHTAVERAAIIDTRGSSLVELEHLLGFRDTTSPGTRLAPLLRDQHLTTLSAAHYQAVREALALNTFKRLDGVLWPTALLTSEVARGMAQLRPVLLDTHPDLSPDELEVWGAHMWQQREALSDLDADALDALSALWLYRAHTPQEDAIAEIDELLTLRGLHAKRGGQGRRGGYETEQRQAMFTALAHVQNLWLNMDALEIYGQTRPGSRRPTPLREAVQSRAFTITDLFGQRRLDGGFDIHKFLFRPGTVFAHFLFGPGRQTALLAAQALRYDPYRQAWEKRLARYLSYQWRCKAHAGRYWQPFRVSTLLTALGVALDERKPSRTRERLEKTLDTLLRDHLIAAWQYERWDESLSQHRDWAQHWLQTTILIEPPEVIQTTYQQLQRHERSLPKTTPARFNATVFGEQLKQQRHAYGWSQIQAAEHFTVNQATWSRLERGRVRCTAALLKRLTQWLETAPPASLAMTADSNTTHQ